MSQLQLTPLYGDETIRQQSVTNGRLDVRASRHGDRHLLSLDEGCFNVGVQFSATDAIALVSMLCRVWAIKPEEIKP